MIRLLLLLLLIPSLVSATGVGKTGAIGEMGGPVAASDTCDTVVYSEESLDNYFSMNSILKQFLATRVVLASEIDVCALTVAMVLTGTITTPITVEIWGNGANSRPDDTNVLASVEYAASDLSASVDWLPIENITPITMPAGIYYIVVETTFLDASNFPRWAADADATTSVAFDSETGANDDWETVISTAASGTYKLLGTQ